jgi:hypothetical protein
VVSGEAGEKTKDCLPAPHKAYGNRVVRVNRFQQIPQRVCFLRDLHLLGVAVIA